MYNRNLLNFSHVAPTELEILWSSYYKHSAPTELLNEFTNSIIPVQFPMIGLNSEMVLYHFPKITVHSGWTGKSRLSCG